MNLEKRIFHHHWIFLLAAFLQEKTAALLSASQTTLLGATQPLTAPAHLSQRACGWIYAAPTWFSMPWISSPLPSRGSLNAQQLIDLKAAVQAPWCYARGYILTHSSLFPTPACKITRCYLFFCCLDLLQSLRFWEAPRWCWLEKILPERHLRPKAAVPVPRVSPVPQSMGPCPSPPAEEI